MNCHRELVDRPGPRHRYGGCLSTGHGHDRVRIGVGQCCLVSGGARILASLSETCQRIAAQQAMPSMSKLDGFQFADRPLSGFVGLQTTEDQAGCASHFSDEFQARPNA